MNPRAFAAVRGLYGMADAEASGGDPERLADALLRAGCRVLQLRGKGWSTDDLTRVATRLRPRCDAADALLLINDDVDACLRANADGAHVGQTDGDLATLRQKLGDERILGVSCHLPDDLAAAAPFADYLAFGPVFTTPHLSRPKPVRGVAALVQARHSAPMTHRLVAIGGITLDNLAQVRAAGADAWAVIGAIAHARDPEAAARAFIAAGS